MKDFISIIVLLSICVSMSCTSKRELSPLDYYNYFKDEKNGLLLKQEVSGMELSLQIETPEFKAINDAYLTVNNEEPMLKLGRTIEEYKGCTYFTLFVYSVNDDYLNQQYFVDGVGYSYNDFNRFFIKDRFSIEIGNEKFTPVDCTYIPGDNLLPYSAYCVVFEGVIASETIEFAFRANEIGLNTCFELKKKNLRKIPELKF